MRIDKYLKVSRIIKRRTLANDACDAGRISVNGNVVKASYDVKIGDVIELKFGEKISKFEVLAVVEHVTKDGAKDMYRPVN
ncbi:MAG: RNA-binding S4 domain-containing protein [Clostridia bacterium]|nr:RNA-binding S4 domain-containing protein [Clostridia bacterium]